MAPFTTLSTDPEGPTTLAGVFRRQGNLNCRQGLVMDGGILYVDGDLNVQGGVSGKGIGRQFKPPFCFEGFGPCESSGHFQGDADTGLHRCLERDRVVGKVGSSRPLGIPVDCRLPAKSFGGIGPWIWLKRSRVD